MASLYAVIPLVPHFDPVLPDDKVFYKVAPLFSASLGAHGSALACASTGDALGALEQRQIALLQQLEALKQQVLAASGSGAGSGIGGSHVPAGVGKQAVHNKPFTPTGQDVVVQTCLANPSLVSLAAAVLLEGQGANLAVRHFWHSSNPTPVPSTFVQQHRGEGSANVDTRVSFVWGNTAQPRAFLHGTHVEGDHNIAKFLCRLHCPALLLEADPIAATLVDGWLAHAHGAAGSKAGTLVPALEAALAKSPFLVGKALTLADVAIWAVLRAGGVGGAHTKSWLGRMEQQPFARVAAAALPAKA